MQVQSVALHLEATVIWRFAKAEALNAFFLRWKNASKSHGVGLYQLPTTSMADLNNKTRREGLQSCCLAILPLP
jgi:hypothetical protein